MNESKLPSSFRAWLQNKWFEHQDECIAWGGTPISNSVEYFRKYRWWLKTIYKKEQRETNGNYT